MSLLKSTERELQRDNDMYGDTNDYTIFDDEKDRGDRGVTGRAQVRALQTKYVQRMLGQLSKKLAVIENYYERQKDQNVELIALLDPINDPLHTSYACPHALFDLRQCIVGQQWWYR